MHACMHACMLTLPDDSGRTSLSLTPHKSGITSVRSSTASLQKQTWTWKARNGQAKLRTTMATSLFMMPTCSQMTHFLSPPL